MFEAEQGHIDHGLWLEDSLNCVINYAIHHDHIEVGILLVEAPLEHADEGVDDGLARSLPHERRSIGAFSLALKEY